MNSFKVKNVSMVLFLTNMQLSLHKTFTDGLESCGLLEDYCGFYQLFGLFTKSVPMKKQTHLHLGSRVNIFLFILVFLFSWATFSPQAPLNVCFILVRLLLSKVIESSHLHANFHV